VDVERLVNGRFLVLSRELRTGLFTKKRIVVDVKMAQKIIQLLQRYQAVLVSKRGRIAGIITNTNIGKIFASKEDSWPRTRCLEVAALLRNLGYNVAQHRIMAGHEIDVWGEREGGGTIAVECKEIILRGLF